jgi:hypothetical protein
VRGDLAAPQLGGIDHIVVQQGRRVDELHSGRQLQRRIARAAGQPRRADREQRAQPLAAGGDQVLGQQRDHADRALHAVKDQRVDAVHVLTREADEAVDGAGGPSDGRFHCVQDLLLAAPPGRATVANGQWVGDRGASRRAQGCVPARWSKPRPLSPKIVCWADG